ncbi:uncharacterized protein EAE97_001944 [Botrytis byssoidea]|uniref:Uncharacterized protein n=1 Tax=Botrytis byssoidea TaxID=139641 RepID=A0A9P5IWU8_9HELO|nr:uncharacterized protein EAE97_001944 [Botrytis byssoidea]KAF7952447.1 hypothetical protein EAE97_001944 [Botrytis byssoidea]
MFSDEGLWRQEKKDHHDVAFTQYCERGTASAAYITAELLRLSRSAKGLADWMARSMRGADMNSALHALARGSTTLIDGFNRFPIRRNVPPITVILAPVRLIAGSDTQVVTPGDWALNNTEQHV